MDQTGHVLLRSAAANYIESNRERFEGFLDTEENFDDYVVSLRRDGEYAGETAIQALSEMFQIAVIVHEPSRPVLHEYSSQHPTQTIHLLYSNNNHYDFMIDPAIPENDSDDEDESKSESAIVISSDTTSSTESEDNGESESSSDDTTVCTYSEDDRRTVSHISQQAVEEILFAKPQPEPQVQKPDEKPQTLSVLLSTVLATEDACLKWMRAQGLLPTTMMCEKCGKKMILIEGRSGHREGYFMCSTCKKQRSIRYGTIFARSHLQLHTLMHAFLRWYLNDPNKTIQTEVQITGKTVVKLKQLLNLLATHILEKKSVMIGGPTRVVEIDEALLHRRKYNRGRGKDPGWVLGGIERPIQSDETPRLFLVLCPNRKKETLIPLIQKWVRPGTILVTDSFKSYRGLSKFGYHHYVVNHKRNFVAPKTLAHTQRIEGEWRHVRRQALPMVGCRMEDVGFFLSAYLYRRTTKNNINRFIQDLKEADKSILDEYIANRAKLQKNNQKKKQDSPVKLPTPLKPKAKTAATGAHRISSWKNDVTKDSVTILRQMKISNSRSLTNPKNEKKLTGLRNTKFEEPQVVSGFSVLEDTQRCLDELDEDAPQEQNRGKAHTIPKAKPKRKRYSRRVLSSVSTRSQKRQCAGRIRGFYKPKKY